MPIVLQEEAKIISEEDFAKIEKPIMKEDIIKDLIN